MARRARVADVHAAATAMPHVTNAGSEERPIYQVGNKSFVFFRNPRPDAFDPETGERYDDVIVFWVGSEADKQALVLISGIGLLFWPEIAGAGFNALTLPFSIWALVELGMLKGTSGPNRFGPDPLQPSQVEVFS